MTYIIGVIIADTSSLKNRALAFAFSYSPVLITIWAGPAAASSFYDTSGWH